MINTNIKSFRLVVVFPLFSRTPYRHSSPCLVWQMMTYKQLIYNALFVVVSSLVVIIYLFSSKEHSENQFIQQSFFLKCLHFRCNWLLKTISTNKILNFFIFFFVIHNPLLQIQFYLFTYWFRFFITVWFPLIISWFLIDHLSAVYVEIKIVKLMNTINL